MTFPPSSGRWATARATRPRRRRRATATGTATNPVAAAGAAPAVARPPTSGTAGRAWPSEDYGPLPADRPGAVVLNLASPGPAGGGPQRPPGRRPPGPQSAA